MSSRITYTTTIDASIIKKIKMMAVQNDLKYNDILDALLKYSIELPEVQKIIDDYKIKKEENKGVKNDI